MHTPPDSPDRLPHLTSALGASFRQPEIAPLPFDALDRLYGGLEPGRRVVAFRMSDLSGIVPMLKSWAAYHGWGFHASGSGVAVSGAESLKLLTEPEWRQYRQQSLVDGGEGYIAVIGCQVEPTAFPRVADWASIALGIEDIRRLYKAALGEVPSLQSLFMLRHYTQGWPLAINVWLALCKKHGRWLDYGDARAALIEYLSDYPEARSACSHSCWPVLARLGEFDNRAVRILAEKADQLHEALTSGVWPVFRHPAHSGWWRVAPLFGDLVSEHACAGNTRIRSEIQRLASGYQAEGNWHEWYDLAQRFRLHLSEEEANRVPASVLLDRGGGWHLLNVDLKAGGGPLVLLRQAWSLALAGRLAESQAILERCEPGTSGHQAIWLLVRAFLSRSEGNLDAAAEAVAQCLNVVGERSDLEVLAWLVKASTDAAQGRYIQAREANRSALKVARAKRLYALEVLALYDLARIELSEGYLHQAQLALKLAREALSRRESRTGPLQGLIPCRLDALCMVERWCHFDRDWLMRHGADILYRAERQRDLSVLIVCVVLSRLQKAQGCYQEAELLLSHAERLMQFWHVDEHLYRNLLDVLRVDIQIDRGRQDLVARGIEQIERTLHETRYPELFPMLPGYFRVAQIKYLIMQERLEAADEAIHRLALRLSGQSPFSVGNVFLYLLRALSAQVRGRAIEAKSMFREALRVAETEGYVNAFVEFGKVLAPTIRDYVKAPGSGQFAERVLNVLMEQVPAVHPEVPPLEEPLSSREMAVLQLIAEGYANKDIGEKLFISLHTVKTHARRINAKLQVRNRTQAIARARELGLL